LREFDGLEVIADVFADDGRDVMALSLAEMAIWWESGGEVEEVEEMRCGSL